MGDVSHFAELAVPIPQRIGRRFHFSEQLHAISGCRSLRFRVLCVQNTDSMTPTEPPDSTQNVDADTDRLAMPADSEPRPRLPFPVVGIGASAGGLTAFTDFFKAMPANNGMAFVLIQHLPPDRESLIADILSRHTVMPVKQVEDGMSVQPDHVYIIRPGHTLTLKDGVLRLGENVEKALHGRPVDDFFRSLAEEQHERAIAVLMSGMGSNGSAGAQAIKAVGGLCIAQDPESAEFPSMPRHMISAGIADYVLRVQEMPDILLAYAGHPYARAGTNEKSAATSGYQQHLRDILAILRTRTRQDFSGYKKPTVLRRIQRRMGLNRQTTLADYVKLLRQNASEVSALSHDLLIHVTGFFRDTLAWETLRREAIIPLLTTRQEGDTVRCWVTACASGEEAYSLAMILTEEAERLNKHFDIKVFATDMADRTLQNARGGTYPGGIESEIDQKRLEKFFQKEDAVYRVRPELRDLVVFAPQNLLQDPPFSRLDIVTCRNLLIYLEPELQQRILRLLHFGLREGGTLFLGTSENAGADDLFETINKKARIYRRIGPTRHERVDFSMRQLPTRGAPADWSTTADPKNVGPRPSITQMTTRALLEHHTPAAVTIDRDYRILYYHGNTEPFVAAPRGEPTRDLMLLARESVRGAIRRAVHRAVSQGMPETVLDSWIENEAGERVRVAVTASLLDAKLAPDYIVISFQERRDFQIHESAMVQVSDTDAAEELKRVRNELQTTIEELQGSNEELKASHEEVISTNEELQSTNEELETSREEMQSLNEELSTVNSQLQAKIEEHQIAHSDLSSLLTSTDIAVLFLDTRFRIRRFTPQVRELLDMIETDVGRPLNDLAKKFTDPNLAADVDSVLNNLVPIEREVSTHDGRWFLRRVNPYRTADNRIDGVVVTFVDISERKKAVDALQQSEEQFRRAIEDAPIPIVMLAENGDVLQLSRTWTELTGYTHADLPTIDTWLNRAYGEGAVAVRTHIRELFEGDRRSVNVELNLKTRDGSLRHWSFSASSPGALRDGRRFVVGMVVDITERHRADGLIRDSEERFRLLVDGAQDLAMIMLDSAGRITAWSEGATRMLQYTDAEATGKDVSFLYTPDDQAAGLPAKELTTSQASGIAKGEHWYVRKDQTRIRSSSVQTPIYHPDGSLRGFVKVMRDETLRWEVQESLRASKDAAEDANRTKDDFLATVSHELRTPLNVIVLWAKMLQESSAIQTDEHLREGVTAIRNSAEAQKELIEDLLDVARITSGQLRLQTREVELLDVVHEAIDSIAPAVEAKNLHIETDFTNDVGIVRADPDRLRQVIWNLLINAAKFTPNEGTINVHVSRHGGEVEIRVRDTGRGIPAEFLPQIFERFTQADASRSRDHGGIGLGLTISRQLVELHGGTIQAHSDGPGKGATLTIRLPLPSLRKGAKKQDQITRGLERGERLIDLQILFVEDDPATRSAIARFLQQAGTKVTAVGSAAEAIEAYQKLRPQVIISDIGLPDTDGFSLLQSIRKIEASQKIPPVPAIALTAYTREQDREKASEVGFQTFFAKPLDTDQLLIALTTLPLE